MKVWAYPIRVAGISRRVKSAEEIGEEVLCEREASNTADPQAVAVFAINGNTTKKIGYLPREIARKIPDGDLPCRGEVIWKGQGVSVGVRIAI